jgi:hypothetical protein
MSVIAPVAEKAAEGRVAMISIEALISRNPKAICSFADEMFWIRGANSFRSFQELNRILKDAKQRPLSLAEYEQVLHCCDRDCR